ncbi:MAG: hypothetical protein AB7T86_15915 [Xanthobacteraceae bacterium]
MADAPVRAFDVASVDVAVLRLFGRFPRAEIFRVRVVTFNLPQGLRYETHPDYR